jgi:pimeloyl-ACP methyl ester carboxylesterase
MKKILVFIVSAYFCFSCSSKAQTNVEVAKRFVTAIAQEKYEAAAALFDPSITQVNKELLETTWKQLSAGYGGYQSYYIPEGVDQNASSVVVGIRFGNGNQGFSCNFNDKHQLVGFLLTQPPPDKAATAEPVRSRFREEERSVAVNGGSIKGSLMLPDNITMQTPIALIIAGSGATDRNGNGGPTLHTNAYKMLAESLAEHGIASFRFDKRLIGASQGFNPDESKLSFDDFVQDAVQLIAYLKEQGYGKIYIIGHSEGALIGTLAAQKANVAAIVSLCGAGENIALTLKRQMNHPEANMVIDELKSGKMTNKVPPSMQVMFRASVQPYLISWMKYDPPAELKKLKIPILIVGGGTDLQVPVADAEMLKKAVPQAELLVINGMNHVLKDAPADRTANMVTYTQSGLPLNKELTEGLNRFLSQK